MPIAAWWAFALRVAAGRTQRFGVFSIAGDDADDVIDRHVLCAFGDDDLGEHALVDGLDLHRRLIGLDLGQHVARLDRIALFLSHLARLPFSIVGERAGIRILIGMFCSSVEPAGWTLAAIPGSAVSIHAFANLMNDLG